MEISITALTANRLFSKALVRLSSQLEFVEDSIKALKLGKYPHDTIMVTFEDKPEEYAEEISVSDEIFQIGVGYDQRIGLKFNDREIDDPQLLKSILSGIEKVLSMYPFTDTDKNKVLKAFNAHKNI